MDIPDVKNGDQQQHCLEFKNKSGQNGCAILSSETSNFDCYM